MPVPATRLHLWLLRLFFLALGLWLLFAAWAQNSLRASAPPAAAAPEREVLILHGADTAPDAAKAGNLIGRFAKPALRDLTDYEAGDARKYDAVFVLPSAVASSQLASVRSDLAAYNRPLVWIAHQAEPLLARAEGAGAVHFKAVGADGQEFPWAVRAGRFTYLRQSPFAGPEAGGHDLVMADFLFDLFAPAAPVRRRALLTLDGVTPLSNPRRIIAKVDLLSAQNLPFAIAVADAQGSGEAAVTLSQRPQLGLALRYAAERGAMLVAAMPQLGEDANLAKWRLRFAAARAEWERAGLEAPAFLATGSAPLPDPADKAAREFYSGLLGSPGHAAGNLRLPQQLPFATVDVNGDFVVPVQAHAGMSAGAEAAVAAARRNLVVRDSLASFALHWDADGDTFETAVREVRRLGYGFVSPAEMLREAPAHAAGAIPRVAPLAMASAAWVRRLPPLDGAALVALLALIAAMALSGEILLSQIGRGAGLPGLRTTNGAPLRA